MQARELQRLDKSLEGFLSKLTAGLGRSGRRCWASVYVRGLLLGGERKSVEPMATRLGESDQDLHHFVSHKSVVSGRAPGRTRQDDGDHRP